MYGIVAGRPVTYEDEAYQIAELTLMMLPAATFTTPVGVAPVATTFVVELERYVEMLRGLPVHAVVP